MLKSIRTGVDQDVSEALLSLRFSSILVKCVSVLCLCEVFQPLKNGPQIMSRAIIPKCSMYGIVTYICHKNQVNVGEYTSPIDSGISSNLNRGKSFEKS